MIPLETILLHEAGTGNLERCRELIAQGADVNAADKDGWTPLYQAAAVGAIEVCTLLLEKGADLNVRTKLGRTALWPAINSRQLDIARLLVENGIDINALDKSGSNVLHRAAWDDNLRLARFLVGLGASSSYTPEMASTTYETPFQSAVKNDSADVADFFIRECGERLEQRTVDGRLVMSMAGPSVRAAYHAFLTEQKVVAAMGDVEEVGSAVKKTGMSPL